MAASERARSEDVAASGWRRETAAREALFRRLLAVADVSAATLSFVLTFAIFGERGLAPWALAALLTVVPVAKLSGLYDRDEHVLNKTTLDEAPGLFRIAALYALLALLVTDTSVDGLRRDGALLLWASLFVFLVALRAIVRRLASRMVGAERCVVIGPAEPAARLADKLERCSGAKAEVVGRIPLAVAGPDLDGPPVLGDLASLAEVVDAHGIDRAVIAPTEGDADQLLLQAIVEVKRLGVRVSVVPSLFEAIGSAFEYDEVEGSTLLGIRHRRLSRSSERIKRGFDVVASALILLLLAPVMAAIAVAVRLDSPGPVFFRQRRVGRHGRVFSIFKFRTMIDGAEAQRQALARSNEAGGGLFKIAADPRITRVGRFLRSTSLDELPQLLNVLRGEMSLVGPRPLVADEDELITGVYRQRALIPPGVTGLWQIYGSARIPLDEMVKIDYLYGANWSLWLDLKILLRTVPFALARRGM